MSQLPLINIKTNNLGDLPIGTKGKITGFVYPKKPISPEVYDSILCRLIEMNLCPGNLFTIKNKGTLGTYPLALEVEDMALVGLGFLEAQCIKFEVVL
jgi:hypothetical protein